MDIDRIEKRCQYDLFRWRSKLEAEDIEELAASCAAIGRDGLTRFLLEQCETLDDMLHMEDDQLDSYLRACEPELRRLLIVAAQWRAHASAVLLEALAGQGFDTSPGFDATVQLSRVMGAVTDLQLPDYWEIEDCDNPFDHRK